MAAKQRIRFISDCHFGHKNILKFRKGFSSVEEHDETIMDNILTTCNKGDTLWILGDMFFDLESLENYGARIREKVRFIHMVLGNHDTDRDARAQNVGRMFEMFDSVHGLKSKDGFWFTHAPMHPDELRGRYNIHGHVHYATVQDERYFNACCENINFAPVTIDKIREGYRGELFDYGTAKSGIHTDNS